MLEREVEAYLKKAAERIGGEVRKVQWIGRRGAPDRLVMIQGHVLWVELKAPGRKPQAHQEREHKKMRKKGMLVFVIDHPDKVDALLETFRLNPVPTKVSMRTAIEAYERVQQTGKQTP